MDENHTAWTHYGAFLDETAGSIRKSLRINATNRLQPGTPTHPSRLPLADPDVYSREYRHPLWMPKGHKSRLTKGPCYDPEKGEERRARFSAPCGAGAEGRKAFCQARMGQTLLSGSAQV